MAGECASEIAQAMSQSATTKEEHRGLISVFVASVPQY